eukprot:367853-Rhodomonas_salina.2
MSIRTVTLNGDAGSIMDANLVDASPFEVAHAQGKMRWHVALVHGRLSTEPSFQSDHLGTIVPLESLQHALSSQNIQNMQIVAMRDVFVSINIRTTRPFHVSGNEEYPVRVQVFYLVQNSELILGIRKSLICGLERHQPFQNQTSHRKCVALSRVSPGTGADLRDRSRHVMPVCIPHSQVQLRLFSGRRSVPGMAWHARGMIPAADRRPRLRDTSKTPLPGRSTA